MLNRWEDEYYAAYKKYSGLLHLNETNIGEKNIVKASSPDKFVNAITKSADKLLGNLILMKSISEKIKCCLFKCRTYSHSESRSS